MNKTSGYDMEHLSLSISEPIESNITFMTSAGKEVMRIDKNGVKINPDFPLDEAAQHVINALDSYIKGMVQAPVLPDPLTYDEPETREYINGWNDCRQAMLESLRKPT